MDTTNAALIRDAAWTAVHDSVSEQRTTRINASPLMVSILVRLLIESRTEAVRQGADAESYCPTAEDLDFIVGKLEGYPPTRKEWMDTAQIAGIDLKWIADRYCSAGDSTHE